MSLSAGAAAGIGAAVSAISAGGSMISAGIKNRKMWKYRQREMALQQKYALEQMQAQYDFNKKMWDESNKYNDPSAIFERFRKAGINPAGVLGSSGASLQASFPMNGNVSAPGLGPTTAGDVSAPEFSGVASSGVQAALSAHFTDSEIERNKAAADLDKAEAENIRNSMPTKEQGQALTELEIQLKRAGIDNQKALASYYGEMAINQEAYNKYADLAATYDFQRIQAAYAEQVERTKRLRAENDAEIPLLEQSAAANLAYLRALAAASNASARESWARSGLLNLQQQDMQRMFEVTWETPVKVPLVDEKGKPTGEFEEITGREYYSYLRGLDLGEGRQSLSGNWFQIRNNKNAPFYEVTKAFATAAGVYTAAKAGGSAGTETMTERYGPDGDFIGGTLVTRRNLRK